MTPPGQHTELAFESAIEEHLTSTSGYASLPETGYDKVRALFSQQVLDFIQATQPKEWKYLSNIQKAKAEETLLADLCRALDSKNEGCLKVLRHGFKCFGKTFRVAYFAPASGLNPETIKLYQSNRLTVTRQLHYSAKNENSLDVVLSLNGIPLVTMELKNPMTGQTWRNAVRQYKNDRDPKELLFQFRRRSLVHFAVDPDEAHMATRLSGKGTRFLPFNRGRGTGAGNPDNPDGYRTAYLWESALERDSFLDILARFIHLETKEKKVGGKKVTTNTMIFPRYHQLDCVRKLVRSAQAEGAGSNYLVQHSAGSGKSNSIAWLAHRLQSLHNATDYKVFDSIVVVTDRRVLDQQLQNTIYQFEHKQGVVVRITEGGAKSTQLAEALEHAAPIIITTLQTFPFVTEKIGTLPERRYAVIIDEAHSSQGGQSSTELKEVLGGEGLDKAAAQQAADEDLTDHEQTILKTMLARGRQPNISFFAFTATPKYKTLEVFGTVGADGKPLPFHLYSMRQAIEEKFILDVLQHYTTYKTYYRLVKSIEDDPEVDKKRPHVPLPDS